MRHARLPAGEPQHQLDGAEHDDEGARLHRDRREQQHHPLVREQHAERQQQAEHATGCAQHRAALADQRRHQQLAQAGAGHAHQIIGGEALLAPGQLQRRAEHVQGQHVEQQVGETTMQEAVGQQLPGLEVLSGRERVEAAAVERPQHERLERLHSQQERLLQDEQHDVGDQQRLGDGGQSGEHGGILGNCRHDSRGCAIALVPAAHRCRCRGRFGAGRWNDAGPPAHRP